MGRFRFLDHTADFGIEATAADLPDLFAVAAQGMFAWIVDLESVKEREARKTTVVAGDLDSLLVNFLNELNYLWETNSFLCKRVEVSGLVEGTANDTDYHITALVHGESFDPARHHIKDQVKAATYHMLSIRRWRSGWRARVILDI